MNTKLPTEALVELLDRQYASTAAARREALIDIGLMLEQQLDAEALDYAESRGIDWFSGPFTMRELITLKRLEAEMEA